MAKRSADTGRLEFGADYPADRAGQMFALNAIKLLALPFVARELGSNGCNLIRVIATLEDNQWYQSAVLATDADLRPMLAVTENTLVTARRRCIAAGWLHYEAAQQRGDGLPSRMWVTIPHNLTLRVKADTWWKNYTKSDTKTVTETDTKSDTKTDPISIPNPEPSTAPPSPPAAPEKTEGWQLVKEEMLKSGIGETSKPLRSLQDNHVPFDLALGVLRYASQMQLWSPGLIRRRLLNLLPKQDPTERRFWMAPDLKPVVASGSNDELRKRDSRLRQLELEFESELKGLTMQAIVDRYPLPQSVREQLRGYPTWNHTSRSSSARLALLEAISSIKQVRVQSDDESSKHQGCRS